MILQIGTKPGNALSPSNSITGGCVFAVNDGMVAILLGFQTFLQR